MAAQGPIDAELDVRTVARTDKHPLIFDRYSGLAVGDSFVLVNDHDPRHLREEFDAEYTGGFDWHYLNRERGNWRIRITKLAVTERTDPARDGTLRGLRPSLTLHARQE